MPLEACDRKKYSDYFLGRYSDFISSIEDESVQKRNIAWVPVAKKYFLEHPNKSFFMCVVVGHFGSELGIINLFKREGCKLHRLSFEGDFILNLTPGVTIPLIIYSLLMEAAQASLHKSLTSYP